MYNEAFAMEPAMHIHVIHENAAWLEPLARALDAERLPWRQWFLDRGVFDLSAALFRLIRCLKPLEPRLAVLNPCHFKPGSLGGEPDFALQMFSGAFKKPEHVFKMSVSVVIVYTSRG